MTLEVDHINGDWSDDRAQNLRLLCPNCHAITSTWCRGGNGEGEMAPPGSAGRPSRYDGWRLAAVVQLATQET